VLVNMLASLVATPAVAAEPVSPPPIVQSLAPEPPSEGLLEEREAPTDVRLVLRGVGEIWHDTAVATRFKSGGLVAGLGGVIPLGDLLAVDAGIGYHRSSGEGEGALQIVPMSLLLEARLQPTQDHGLELFGGLGPAMVVWSESGQDPTTTAAEGQDEGPTVLRGARPGLEVRLGTRIDLGLVQPSMMPGQQDALKGVELELLGARRFATTRSGFNWNTWRLGAGLALRF